MSRIRVRPFPPGPIDKPFPTTVRSSGFQIADDPLIEEKFPFRLAQSRLFFGIVKFAIQVASRPRKGTIPPEEFCASELLFLPVLRTPGQKKEKCVSRELPSQPNLNYLRKEAKSLQRSQSSWKLSRCPATARL